MTTTSPISQRLKDDNWDLHQIAERHSSLTALLRGQMGLSEYVAIIEQAWVSANALDGALRAACVASPEVDALVDPDDFFRNHIRQDLEFFERDPGAIAPSPGTSRYVDHIEAHKGDPMHILGLHYVRLGACNGNRFVAKKAREVLDLPANGDGTRYLDPFGEAQRPRWVDFKNKLDATDWSGDERDRIFAGTRAMYEYAISMEKDDRHRGADELLAMHVGTLDREAFARAHTVQD